MAKRKFSQEQILGVVKQLEAGRTAAEMAREVGGSTFTVYSWKAKYGGMDETLLPRMLELLAAGWAHLVVGSRYINGGAVSGVGTRRAPE